MSFAPVRRAAALLLLLACFLAGTAAAQQDAATRSGEPATLQVWNRPIVTLRATRESVTPAERVARIRQRLDDLSEHARAGEVRANRATIAGLDAVLVTVDAQALFLLVSEDLDPESGETLDQLGARTEARLRDLLAAQAKQREFPALVRSILCALGSLLVLLLVMWALLRLRDWILRRLEGAARSRQVLGVDVGSHVHALQKIAVKTLAIALILVALDVCLTYALVQFPYTKPWGDGLLDFVLGQLAILGRGALEAVPQLFTVVLILLAARLVARASERFFQGVEEGRIRVSWMEPDTAKATRRIALLLIWGLALVFAYPYVPGSNSRAFTGFSVLAGLMLSLGSSGLINHMMSGLVIIYSRALSPGDYVHVGEVQGTVGKVGVLSTKIVTPRNEEVTIPNAVLVGDRVTNYTRLAEPDGSTAATSVTIGYDAPWRQVHALLEEAAAATPGLRAGSRPRVYQRALSDFYVEYELWVNLDRPDGRVRVLSELHQNVQDAFNRAGVQIMSPHFLSQPADKVWVPREQWNGAPQPDAGKR